MNQNNQNLNKAISQTEITIVTKHGTFKQVIDERYGKVWVKIEPIIIFDYINTFKMEKL